MKRTPLILCLALLAAVVLATGCVRVREPREYSESVPLNNAQSAEVQLKMGAGELRIESGTSELMEALFRTNTDREKPRIDYHLLGSKALLTVQQGKRRGFFLRRNRNSWTVRLNENVPVELKIDFGAGDADLDLSRMDIRGLDVDMGVGNLEIDLSGTPKRDLDVNIDGGIGHGTLYLPETVGVRVRVDGGLGSVDFHGFRKDGRIYTNDAYGKSDILVDVNVDAGIGSLELRLK